MWQRLSNVDQVRLATVGSSASVLIGDVDYFNSKRLAVGVEQQSFDYDSNDLGESKLIKLTHENPADYAPIYEDIRIQFIQQNPVICVDNINVLGATTAASLHIGNGRYARLQSTVRDYKKYN